MRALHGAVVLLIILAGCSAIPGSRTPLSPDHSVSITIANNHDEPYTVRVTPLPPEVDGLEVTYENGSTRRFDVSSFDALPRDSLRNATGIATTVSEERTEEFTVGPSEGIGTTLEDVPANATVVYFVLPASGPERVRGAGVARCTADTENTELAITIRPDGSLHSAVTCSDDTR